MVGRFLTGLARRRVVGRAPERRACARAADRVRPHDERAKSRPTATTGSTLGPAGRCSRGRGSPNRAPGKHPLDEAVRVRADPARRCRHRAPAHGRLRIAGRDHRRLRASRRAGGPSAPATSPTSKRGIPLGDGEEPHAGAAARAGGRRTARHRHRVADHARVRAERRAGGRASTCSAWPRARSSAAGHRTATDVYAASRGTDPKTGEPTTIEVEVQDTGVVTTFCIVNVPGLSELAPEIPYVSAQILLDGADNTFFGLIRGVAGRRRAHGHAREGQVGRRAEGRPHARSCGSNPPANPTPTTTATRTTCDARRRGCFVRVLGRCEGRVAQRGRDDRAGRARSHRRSRAFRGTTSGSCARAVSTTSRAGRSRSSWGSTAWARGRRCVRATSRWTRPGRCTKRGLRSRPARSTARSSTASARSSPGDLHEIMTLQTDPYYVAPLWPSMVDMAALQATAYLDAAGRDETDLAEVAARSQRNAQTNPHAVRHGRRRPSTRCSPDRSRTIRCATPTSRRSPTVRRRSCSRQVTSPGRCATRPAWIRGIEHRIEAHGLGVRDLTRSESTALAARAAGIDEFPLDVVELHAQFSHEELILADALGLDGETDINPSGGPLAANPVMSTGLIRIGEVARRITAGEAEPRARARVEWSVLATEPGVHSGGATDGWESCRSRRRRADRAPHRTQGRVDGRPRPRSRGRSARRRGHDVVGYRRGRDRQGTRHVRGRRDARAVPRGRARRGRQADDARSHRRFGRRFDVDRRGQARRRGCTRAGAHRRVREAVGEQRDLGPVGADAVPGAAGCRCGWLLRAAHPCLHVSLGRAAPHRPPGRGEGPPGGAAQSESAPAPARHRLEDGRGVVSPVGPAALPRCLPVVRRRDGARARQ